MNGRKFGPKTSDHPSVGETCIYCNEPFVAGDYTTLVPTEPADEEERQKMLEGRPHTSAAIEVHWNCLKCKERTVAEMNTQMAGWAKQQNANNEALKGLMKKRK